MSSKLNTRLSRMKANTCAAMGSSWVKKAAFTLFRFIPLGFDGKTAQFVRLHLTS